MSFDRTIDGMELMLKIRGYQFSTDDNYDDAWCECDFRFHFEGVVDYHREKYEVLLSSEVDILDEKLTELLEGKISETSYTSMTEPDFIFILKPQEDLRNNPNFVYVAPGYEIKDIEMEWRVYFWHDGLTENYLSVTLFRDDIVALRDYIRSIRLSEKRPEGKTD